MTSGWLWNSGSGEPGFVGKVEQNTLLIFLSSALLGNRLGRIWSLVAMVVVMVAKVRFVLVHEGTAQGEHFAFLRQLLVVRREVVGVLLHILYVVGELFPGVPGAAGGCSKRAEAGLGQPGITPGSGSRFWRLAFQSV